MNEEWVMRPGDKARVLTSLLEKQINLINTIETRANITIGLSGAILAYVISTIPSGITLESIVLVVTTILSITLSLLALKPPRSRTARGQENSIFYHKKIANMDYQEFENELHDIIGSEDRIIRQYALETYNIVKYHLIIKKYFAHAAIKVLLAGFVISVVTALFFNLSF